MEPALPRKPKAAKPPENAAGPEKINPRLLPLAVAIGSLREDPDNVRQHDARSIDTIAASLKEYGQQKPIVVAADGTVRAGNGTLQAARKLGWLRIATVVFDGDERRLKAFAIMDNRSAELSSFDEGALAQALEALQASGEDFDVESIGFTDAEAMKLAGALEEADEDDDADDDDDDDVADLPSGSADPLAPQSHVRMVQLFLNEDNQPVFMQQLKALAHHHGTDSVTDTVLKVIEEAAQQLAATPH